MSLDEAVLGTEYIIKDISTDDTDELKLKLEEQLNKKFVFE